MNRPLVPRDDFWADLVNAFFLRAVYRTPTRQNLADPRKEAVLDEAISSTLEVHPRHSALRTEESLSPQSGSQADPKPTFHAEYYLAGIKPPPPNLGMEEVDNDRFVSGYGTVDVDTR